MHPVCWTGLQVSMMLDASPLLPLSKPGKAPVSALEPASVAPSMLLRSPESAVDAPESLSADPSSDAGGSALLHAKATPAKLRASSKAERPRISSLYRCRLNPARTCPKLFCSTILGWTCLD